MATPTAFLEALPAWLRVAVLLAVLLASATMLGLVFERIIIASIRRITRATRTDVDDLIVKAVHPAVVLLVVILAIDWGLHRAAGLMPQVVLDAWGRLAIAFAVLLAAIVVARILSGLLRHSTRLQPDWRPAAKVGAQIANVTVYVIALLVVLGTYGVSITPLITSLGIAGLAVALALQDTLANFFAGIWMQGGRSIRPGHYVKIQGTDLEGYVVDVGWRTTQIRQLANNIILVPNAKLAQSIVIDHHVPEPRMSLLVRVSVGYECDPGHVEAVIVEEATRAAPELEGMLAEPAPFVRFIPGFGDSSLDLTLVCQVREYVDQYLVQSELRKRIYARFRREGIRIPYPIRDVYMVPPERPDVAPE